MCRYNTELHILVAVVVIYIYKFWYTYLLYLQMKYWVHILWNFYIINIYSHVSIIYMYFNLNVISQKFCTFYPFPHPPIELMLARFYSAFKVSSNC